MKLIKTMLVGVFVFSVMFAQQNPPAGGPPQGGDMQNKSAGDHFMMAVQEGMDRGVLDDNDREFLMGMVSKMKDAVAAEYNDGADGAAGDVGEEFEEWLQGLRDEGGESEEFANRLAMELCMVEQEAHMEINPDGDHGGMHCGPHPAEQAYMDAMNQGASPEDAFRRAARAAQKFEQENQGDEFNQDEFEQATRNAQEAYMRALDDGADPMQAFGDAMSAGYGDDDHDGDHNGQDHGDDHMGGDHQGGDHMGGDDHGDQPPFSPSIMNSVHKYMKNNWAVDDSKMDNQEWMDAYNSYDDWKPQGHENRGGDTYWADQAYQIDGNQEHYDILMSMPEEDREKAYNQIKEDVERHRAEGDHDGDDHMDGDHDGGPQGGPDGPSDAVVQAWMSGMQQDGGFDFDAAFDAAESTAKQEAQDAGEYDEAAWDECADAGREAMENARADEVNPQEVFAAVAQAVNNCGQAQQEANKD